MEMMTVKLLIQLVRSTAVVSNRKLHQPIFSHDKGSSVFKKFNVSTPPNVADPNIEKIPAPLQPLVRNQGELICQLTEPGACELVKKAAAELKAWTNVLEDSFDLARMKNLLIRQFFFNNSLTSYDGFSGQLDFGPMGCFMKDNILEAWEKFFILQEQMQLVESSVFTPERVFRASGHLDKHIELLVMDEELGERFEVNHLIKAHLKKIMADEKTTAEVKLGCKDVYLKLDGMTKDEITAVLRRFKMKSPVNGNNLSKPFESNLKYTAFVASTGYVPGYLSPELALGMFVNFKGLLESNQSKLPFAAAQMGRCFRHDISPGSGLIRYREFNTAVFEHFCDPNDKSHPDIDQVRDVRVLLYSSCHQVDGKTAEYKTIGEAVDDRIIANETLAYYMARTQMYMVKIGVDPKKLRFRQHISKEMAQFAFDCWHAECLTSYGWIECVGCADRSDYDLSRYTKATGVSLVSTRSLPEPRTVDVVRLESLKDAVCNAFKTEAEDIMEHLAKMDATAVGAAEELLTATGEFHLELNGSSYRLTSDMVQVKRYQETQHVEEFFPNVIEASFDIDRIMNTVLEHNFRVRSDDDQKTYFSLPPIIAPLKCSVLSMSSNPELAPFVRQLVRDLTRVDVSHKKYDFSGSIEQHHALMDEISIPYSITIDLNSLKEPYTATLRERDSTHQVRIPISEIAGVVHDLSCSKISWTEVEQKYPKFQQ